MRLLPVALFLIAPCALAQFSDIAVTDDASQIYFVSRVPLRGESNPGGGIYRWSGERWEQFVPPFENVPGPDPYRSTYRVRPVVSGGGTVVAWVEEHRCSVGPPCTAYPTYWNSVITTADGQRTSVTGRVQISRNGRYAIQAADVVKVAGTYRDFQTGRVVDLDFHLLGVLSDGRVLGSDAGEWFLWSPSGARQQIAGRASVSPPLISDNGARIIAVRSPAIAEVQPELIAVSVDTGRQTSLGQGIAAGISNDGLHALILGPPPLTEPYLVDVITGARKQLLPGVNVNSAALAGFGHFAVLTTTDGRVMKVNVATGQAEELIARTPYSYLPWPSEAVPCSALRLSGENLTGLSEEPSVTLDGGPVPVLSASEDAIWVQVPCELEPSPVARLLELRSASPFGMSMAVRLPRTCRKSFLPGMDIPPIRTSREP